MCLEDIKIQRAIKTRAVFCPSELTTTLPANDNRLAVRLVPVSSGHMALVSNVGINNGSGSTAFPQLGYACYNFDPSATGATSNSTLPDTVTLENVGEILKGELKTQPHVTDGWLIETYLDVSTPPVNANGESVIK